MQSVCAVREELLIVHITNEGTDYPYRVRVERQHMATFMGDYYRQARVIQTYSSLVVEQCRARTTEAAPSRRSGGHTQARDGQVRV